MTFTIECEKEEDSRWLAEVFELPGVLAYGQTSDEAIVKLQALALRVMADRLEYGESAHEFVNISTDEENLSVSSHTRKQLDTV